MVCAHNLCLYAHNTHTLWAVGVQVCFLPGCHSQLSISTALALSPYVAEAKVCIHL